MPDMGAFQRWNRSDMAAVGTGRSSPRSERSGSSRWADEAIGVVLARGFARRRDLTVRGAER